MSELEIIDPANVAMDKLRALSKPFDPAEYLATKEEAAAYLSEVLAASHYEEIASALGVVARSRSMRQLAADTGLNEKSLYRALSTDGNPRLSTLLKVLDEVRAEPSRASPSGPLAAAVT